MTAFMEEYEKQAKEVTCIPNFEMNRPFIPGIVPGQVGLELEIEGNNLPSQGQVEKVRGKTSGAVWHTKTDGSLRGEALEYVLSSPCNVDEVDSMIDGLYDLFGKVGTELRLTNRCSTHVHVNMTGKKVNEITSAIALWTAFEEPLTLWAGEERVNNHFCLTAKDVNQGTVGAWRSFLRTGSTRWTEHLKYSALNILTLNRFGSLEYRVMNASEDPQRLIDWTKFVFHMTSFAGTQFKNPMSLLYAMSERGGRDLFHEICEKAGVSPAFVTGVMDTVPDMNRAVLEGFRRAQPIVAGFDWNTWMPEIEKEYIIDPFGNAKKKKTRIEDFWVEEVRPAHRLEEDFAEPADLPVPPAANPAIALRHPRDAATPPRPLSVPAQFQWDGPTRQWVATPDYVDRRVRLVTAVATLQERTVDFTGHYNPRRRVDWSRPVEFTNGTPAEVISISRNGTEAAVVALQNIRSVRGRVSAGSQAYLYSVDGLWQGGMDGYPCLRNVGEVL